MDTKKLESLKLALKRGAPIDPELVGELIQNYEGVVRAEEYWGDRAPKLVDEINALRPLETSLRAMVTHSRLVTDAAEAATIALVELDAVRSKQAAS
jgi:hypothetical protein